VGATRRRYAEGVISFDCRCGAKISVPDHLGGQRGACPGCRRKLKAPEPAAPALPEDAPRFRVIRVPCACGREVAAPLARVRDGLARCPSCERRLAVG
jgi:hypothetical protein